ncbi:MAG TPA: hypothetical protein VNN98_01635 [Rhizomicrobium sp.]|nr:hypothetical protein [Rhizomicrobium sp.]
MPRYTCKRYRRRAPGEATGTLIDALTFSATSAAEAEDKIRRNALFRIADMDWEKDFATLEDESGTVLVTWLRGVLHA